MLTLLVLYLVVVEPIYGYKKYAEFKENVRKDPGCRIRYYRYNLCLLWGLTLYLAVAYWINGVPFSAFGFHPMVTDSFAIGLITVLMIGTVLPVVMFAASKKFKENVAKQLAVLKEFLPANRQEKGYWVLISFTAGFCEEILFRSFLFYYFALIWPDIPVWLIVALSSVLFGLAHAYQGVSGVLTTTFLGVVFALLYHATNSIYPGIVIHFLFDLRILAFLYEPKKKGFTA